MALTGQQLRGIIDTHQAKMRKERRRWDKYRSWYLGEFWGNLEEDLPQGASTFTETNEDVTLETNYPYAYIDTMIANVCPTNPQITVNARRDKLREAAYYREALVNDAFNRLKMHTILWNLSSHAAICGRAFLKTVWNFKRQSPDFFSVDPRFVFFDMSAQRWEDIRYLVEVTVLTRAEFESRTKKRGKQDGKYNKKVAEQASFGGYPSWLRDFSTDQSMFNTASKDVYEWVTVYEFYDFDGEGRYFHMLEDVDEPLFEGELPYTYQRNPFICLTFNENMMDLGGLSDIKLIASVQERLNELDTLELWHAQSSIPVMMVNTGMVDNPEMILNALRNATEPGSMIEIAGTANAPLRDLIDTTPTPQLQPGFDRMRERAVQIIEFVLGIPQYSRGVVGVTDVATEVALADTATRTRNGRRIRKLEDMIQWAAGAIISLYDEFLPADSLLPIRLTDSTKVIEANREALKLRNLNETQGASPLEYDYEAIAYSPTENHRLIQLRNIQQYLPMLMEAPNIDKEKLVVKLLDLLLMRDLAMEAEQADAQMPPGAGFAPMPPSPDTLATGALPPGVQEPVTPPLPGGGPGSPMPSVEGGFQGAGSGFEGANFPGAK